MTEGPTGAPHGLLTPMIAILLTYAAVILLTRLAGPRSFTRISGFDFAATIAMGSLIASAAIGMTPVWSGIAALGALFAGQWVVSWTRRQGWGRDLVDNRPVLLMDGPQVVERNLAAVGLVEADLAARLRAAGVSSREEVRAVVLETSGDLSVILGDGGADALDPVVAAGIRR